MKRWVVCLAAMAAIFFSPGISAQEIGGLFSYRFLWPEDAGAPGKKLVELKIAEEGSSQAETPLGMAEVESYGLFTPSGEKVAEARVMKISGRDDLVIFMTELLKPVTAPTGVYELPAFAFPAIRPDRQFQHLLDFKVEEFVTPVHRAVATTGPVVMYSSNLDALVLSPLDNFMAAMQSPVRGEWRCGFGGLIKDIPAGTISQYLLVSGKGVNDTFMKWGSLIQNWHGHKPADPYADVAMSRLGYWTDNGSYYYYRTEPGKNYSQTLLAVKEYADREGIPYGYFQLDSWWYPKAEIKLKSSHLRGGFLLWEPEPEFFPEGLPAFRKELGLPIVAHNRYASDESPYCKKYGCAPGKSDDKRKGAYPLDPAFWDEVMDNAVEYGFSVYEQDWLYTHMDMIPWMREGIHNAESWYDNMANAAAKRGLTMQLCMASPEFFMQNLKHLNETHARTSHDYKGGLPKRFFWAPFHKAGLFAYAVGLWPFKDNFQSSAGQRPTYNIMPEANPLEEALVSSLSGGPVGPSDKIGASDSSLILRTCRKDGLLLKPDRPATPIDIMFLYNQRLTGGRKPWVVTTESKRGIGKTVYLAAFNLWPESMFQPFVTFAEAGISGKHLIYNYLTGDYRIGSDRINFGIMPPEKAFYYVLCPLLENGMALIGETGKFITMSAKRFPSVKLIEGELVLSIEGVPGEKITLAVYTPGGIKVAGASLEGSAKGDGVKTISLALPESGSSEVRISSGVEQVGKLTIASPDQKLKAVLFSDYSGRLRYELFRNGKPMVESSELGIIVDGLDLGADIGLPAKLESKSFTEELETIGNHCKATVEYSEAVVPLASGETKWQLQVRVFNDGFAFRYLLPSDESLKISGEASSFQLPAGSVVFLQTQTRNYEGIWRRRAAEDVSGFLGMPLVVKLPGQSGYALISEAAVFNYSGMTLSSDKDRRFRAAFEDDKEWTVSPDKDLLVKSPWRVVIAVDDLDSLVNSDVIFSLNPAPDPALFGDARQWIKPGRALWSWWSENTGNPALAREYAEAAATLGFEYILIDAGWEKWGRPGKDKWKVLQEVVEYAEGKGVKVWVWKHWLLLADPNYRDDFFAKVRESGAVGVKIDFMDSESKSRLEFYESAMADAARHKLMVNFHGANKPAGEWRTYPNEMTREGIRGLEYNKGVGFLPASHNVIAAMTRNLTGPMDYTPVTFNRIKLGETTFAHQLATAVVFTSFVTHYADKPENFLNKPGTAPALDVLKSIPTVWDETIVLEGSELGEVAALARRSGEKWLVGVINADNPGKLTVKLDFLSNRKYQAIILSDQKDDKAAFKREDKLVNKGDKIETGLAPGGGAVIMLVPERAEPKGR